MLLLACGAKTLEPASISGLPVRVLDFCSVRVEIVEVVHGIGKVLKISYFP